MNYLKLKNAPLKILEVEGKINWKAYGLDEVQISRLIVQYMDDSDFISYLPINNEDVLTEHLPAILTKINGFDDSSIEIVADDRQVWLQLAVEAKNRQNDPTINMSEQEKRNYTRNEIIEQASVIYNGVLITVSTYDIALMDRFTGTITRRNKKINWKGFDPDTGVIVRIELNGADFEIIKDAVFDQSQLIHVESDTQIPVNPWPLEI